MRVWSGLMPLLCLVGHAMCQGRFYSSSPMSTGSLGVAQGGSMGGTMGVSLGGPMGVSLGGTLRGRSRTADLFNSNLHLDTVAQFGSGSFGGSPSFDRRRGGSFGQTFQQDPSSMQHILGSSVIGRELRMGERGLPRHGGAGIGEEYADGRNNGWDGNPQTLTTQYQSSWSDPFRGHAIPQLPIGFNGDFASVGGLFGSRALPQFRGHRHGWYNGTGVIVINIHSVPPGDVLI